MSILPKLKRHNGQIDGQTHLLICFLAPTGCFFHCLKNVFLIFHPGMAALCSLDTLILGEELREVLSITILECFYN